MANSKNIKRVKRHAVIKTSLILCVIMVGIGAVGYSYHVNAMNKLEEQVKKEQEQEDEDKVKEAVNKMNAANENLNVSLAEKSDLEKQIDELEEQIAELLTEDNYVVDADTIKEEIHDIGELATLKYMYTEVGVIQDSKILKIINIRIPGTEKHAIVTMDGVIKIGIDLSDVIISSNEETKSINVTIPKAKILSDELDEKTTFVYNESDGLFNKITIDDDKELRVQIKEKAEEKVKNGDVINRATENAKDVILNAVESIPGVTDRYTVNIKVK